MKRIQTAHSAFKELGLKKTIEVLIQEVQTLYLEDQIPWVVGYSGGKDSSATLQLVWSAIQELSPEQRTKPIHVISTDTLVENPVVASWVNRSLIVMEKAARKQDLPITPHRLTPEVKDTFWVNLIGKGYPAPRHKFRWCTDRLKIKPSNQFISEVVKTNGEAILILGTRKAESQARAKVMAKYESKRMRDKLSPNGSLPNALVYSPIEDWSNDDVWTFLMQIRNPWGHNNKDLLTMYQGASADGECPLVVDTTTPSCGNSRFGCWVCTMVDKDKSMHAMIQNDEEKEWMLPLLEFRNALDITDDRPLRDFRRMGGNVQLFHDRPIPGPYKQQSRADWLRKLLEIQAGLQKNEHEHIRTVEVISMDELQEIRRIWVIDKHESEDLLPRIYAEVLGKPYPYPKLDDDLVFGHDEMHILKELCEDDLQFEMARELLDIERQFHSMSRRAGLYEAIEQAIERSFYTDAADATEHALTQQSFLKEAEGEFESLVHRIHAEIMR